MHLSLFLSLSLSSLVTLVRRSTFRLLTDVIVPAWVTRILGGTIALARTRRLDISLWHVSSVGV